MQNFVSSRCSFDYGIQERKQLGHVRYQGNLLCFSRCQETLTDRANDGIEASRCQCRHGGSPIPLASPKSLLTSAWGRLRCAMERNHAQSPMNSSLLGLGAAGAIALQLALMTAGCTDMLYSDSQNFGRRSAQARQSALRSMQLSSSQANAAQPVGGQALVQLLSGNTHVQPYRKRSEDTKPYITH